MDQSGYSYCSSTATSALCLNVNTVRLSPGWISPSTVQTSRFSFFSRETNLALAPCSTASTRAIESFQRNPNGGTNSSAANACCAQRTTETIRPTKKNWRIICWFEGVTHIETRPVVSVSVACIYNLLSV